MMFVAVKQFNLGSMYDMNPRLPTDLDDCDETIDLTNITMITPKPPRPDL